MKKVLLVITIIIIFIFPIAVNAGRGCCSWHGGQDYCDTETGKWVCKDGTYSPSCTCHKTQTNTSNNISTSNNNNSDKSDNLSLVDIILSVILFALFGGPIVFSILFVCGEFIILLLPQKYADKIMNKFKK